MSPRIRKTDSLIGTLAWLTCCLSLDLAKQIAVALVSSKLDYCNSLFHNMPEKDIARLQRVQNCLARVVTKAPRLSRSFPILKRLHRLPVKFRIHFKICAITFRTLKDRLSDWYGISGQAQIWFSSYLQNRHQSVKIKDTFSDKVTLSYGVPQGSVLGPALFTLYTTPPRYYL